MCSLRGARVDRRPEGIANIDEGPEAVDYPRAKALSCLISGSLKARAKCISTRYPTKTLTSAHPFVFWIGNDPEQLLDTFASDWRNN
jgi:hypothetical protein